MQTNYDAPPIDLRTNKARWWALVIVGVLVTVFVCGQVAGVIAETDASMPHVQSGWHPGVVGRTGQLANPASANCVELGGALSFALLPDGSQYGVCSFLPGMQCEEWALLRGQCPRGGVKAANFKTAAARFCAISGGTYAVTMAGDVRTERGSCRFASGAICDANDYWVGTCGAQ